MRHYHYYQDFNHQGVCTVSEALSFHKHSNLAFCVKIRMANFANPNHSQESRNPLKLGIQGPLPTTVKGVPLYKLEIALIQSNLDTEFNKPDTEDLVDEIASDEAKEDIRPAVE